jgi:hypothetical protein
MTSRTFQIDVAAKLEAAAWKALTFGGNKARADFGEAAAIVGSPDFVHNDAATSFSDALTNVLHAAARAGLDTEKLIERAAAMFVAEVQEPEGPSDLPQVSSYPDPDQLPAFHKIAQRAYES